MTRRALAALGVGLFPTWLAGGCEPQSRRTPASPVAVVSSAVPDGTGPRLLVELRAASPRLPLEPPRRLTLAPLPGSHDWRGGPLEISVRPGDYELRADGEFYSEPQRARVTEGTTLVRLHVVPLDPWRDPLEPAAAAQREQLVVDVSDPRGTALRWLKGDLAVLMDERISESPDLLGARIHDLVEERGVRWNYDLKYRAVILIGPLTPMRHITAAVEDVDEQVSHHPLAVVRAAELRSKPQQDPLALPAADSPVPIRPEAITVSGYIQPELIHAAVARLRPRYERCVAQGLRRIPNLAGRIEVRFELGVDGVAANITDAGSPLADAETTACVLRAFHWLDLGHSDPRGVTTVICPFKVGTE